MTRANPLSRARKVRLLIVDVDGVLTDGRIVLSSGGDELKFFDVKDGFGLVLARQAGWKTALITAEKTAVVAARAKRLKIDWVAQHARDKAQALRRCLAHFRIPAEEAAYIGDDLLDLPVLARVGFAASPADAHPEARRRAHYVARKPGGRGAVREIIDFILRAQGRWPGILQRYA